MPKGSSGRTSVSSDTISNIVRMASGGERSDNAYNARVQVRRILDQTSVSPVSDLYSNIHRALSTVIYYGDRRDWGGRNLTNYNQAVSDLERLLGQL